MTKICEWCELEFEADLPFTRFCSSTCRMRARNQRRKDAAKPMPARPVDPKWLRRWAEEDGKTPIHQVSNFNTEGF